LISTWPLFGTCWPSNIDCLGPFSWTNHKIPINYFQAILEGGISALIAEASEWEEVPEEWVERLKNLLENAPYERELDCQKFQEDAINVLCHGDCWSNNFMFKKEDGEELE